jgi:hypothetical protein
MRIRELFTVICLAAGCLYVAPTILEWALVARHVDPWLICVLLGDLAGCAFLFWLRLRLAACGLYVATGVFKTIMLRTLLVPPLALIWFTDLIPALCGIYVLSMVLLRGSVAD